MRGQFPPQACREPECIVVRRLPTGAVLGIPAPMVGRRHSRAVGGHPRRQGGPLRRGRPIGRGFARGPRLGLGLTGGRPLARYSGVPSHAIARSPGGGPGRLPGPATGKRHLTTGVGGVGSALGRRGTHRSDRPGAGAPPAAGCRNSGWRQSASGGAIAQSTAGISRYGANPGRRATREWPPVTLCSLFCSVPVTPRERVGSRQPDTGGSTHRGGASRHTGLRRTTGTVPGCGNPPIRHPSLPRHPAHRGSDATATT